MAYTARYLEDKADIIDINMGCPAPKVVKNGDGSKLLLDIKKAEKIIEAVVKNTTKPVTLKIRIGWDHNNIVAVDFAKMAESKGISAITVHGRTRTDFYSGMADLDVIKKVKGNDIILMHDTFKTSIEAAVKIVDKLLEEDYTFVTVSEFYETKNIIELNK